MEVMFWSAPTVAGNLAMDDAAARSACGDRDSVDCGSGGEGPQPW